MRAADEHQDEHRDGDGVGGPAGDPACWLDRVCPACGRLAEGEPRPDRCPACGEPLPGE